MKHGKGDWRKVASNPKCNRFEGDYQFDKKNGVGTFTWESGNIYNGNYITSDRAWYELLDDAERKNIEVHQTPVEVFYNNPNYGGDELNWKAEIYMPLKNN